MPPKNKGQRTKKASAVSAAGATKEAAEAKRDADILLQREYDVLTDNHNTLRRRLEQLRHENDFLQKEVEQTQSENQEYVSFVSQRNQKHHETIVLLNEKNQQKLEKIKKDGETELAKYTEQAHELKREIMEKEHELALLKSEVDKFRESEGPRRQQQLTRIAELQEEAAAMQRRHTQELHGRNVSSLHKQKHHERQAKQVVHAFTVAATQEASKCLAAHVEQVLQENVRLRAELQQLVRKSHALDSHCSQLQERRRQLLLDKDLRQMRLTTSSRVGPAGGTAAESAGPVSSTAL